MRCAILRRPQVCPKQVIRPMPTQGRALEHGLKCVFFLLPTILRDVVLPQAEFPHWLPIQMLQIADFVLVGFPL
jgi:hypothetical protein